MSSVVYSPDFPDTYATGRVCYWTIRVPGASRIHFSFPLFDIRDSADMVELLDGYTHRVLARFHGRNRPPLSFNVSLDFVILYFFSDRINQAQGFAVLYQGETSLPPWGLFRAHVPRASLLYPCDSGSSCRADWDSGTTDSTCRSSRGWGSFPTPIS